jgi:hypothetical protein
VSASVADAPMYLLTGAAAIFSKDHRTNGSHAKYIFEQRQACRRAVRGSCPGSPNKHLLAHYTASLQPTPCGYRPPAAGRQMAADRHYMP